MIIGGIVFKASIDSQASVNIMDKASFDTLSSKTGAPKSSLRKPKSQVFGYDAQTPLPILGEIKAKVYVGNAQTTTTVSVVDGNAGNLLSFTTSSELGLIKITNSMNIVSLPTRTGDLLAGYDDLFSGIGKAKNEQIKLHIDNSVQPKIQKHRRIPFHVRKDVDAAIDQLLNEDIIERATGPTPWISPIVIVPKKI